MIRRLIPLVFVVVFVGVSCGYLGDHGARHWSDANHNEIVKQVRSTNLTRREQDCMVSYTEDHFDASQIMDGAAHIRAHAEEAFDYCVRR